MNQILLSVFDKSGIVEFAKQLVSTQMQIYASEGTGRVLSAAAVPHLSAEKASHNPQKLQDCIKTISYYTAASILFDRKNHIHTKEVSELGIPSYDVVVCNFPPLESVVLSPADFNIQHVDVGGPLMVRAAAVNFKDVIVVVDITDYNRVAQAILTKKTDLAFRKELAIKAFQYCSAYDTKISQYLQRLT